MSPRRQLVIIALIAAAYFVSFSRTIGHGFVWDDAPEIETNPSFDRPLLDGITLTQTERAQPDLAEQSQLWFAYDSYRPLTFASYWIDIHLWGRSAAALHAVNVVLGALALLLAFLIALRWSPRVTAWPAVALFALHPIQIEAVAYVSARGDLLAGVFALLATYGFLRGSDASGTRGRAGWGLLAVIAFACSLLAKESYLLLPVALLMIAWARDARTPRVLLGVLAALIPGYLALRSAMLHTQTGPAYRAAIVQFPAIVLEYVRGILLPFDLSIERTPRLTAWLGWLVAALAAGVLAVARWRRRAAWPQPARIALASAGWFIALLAPSVLAVSTTHVVADRYAYGALLGLGIGASVAAQHLVSRATRLARPLAGAALLWGLLCGVVAWRQVAVWHDRETLYRHTVAVAPDSSRANYRVAYLEIEAADWDSALPYLERAIELDPTNTAALNNLAVYRLRAHDYAGAEVLLLRAVAVNPARFNSWLNLGLAQIEEGKREVGCESVQRALTLNPHYELAAREYARRCSR